MIFNLAFYGLKSVSNIQAMREVKTIDPKRPIEVMVHNFERKRRYDLNLFLCLNLKMWLQQLIKKLNNYATNV